MADYMPTSAQDVINSFEASFQDKKEIPEALELEWLNKAVGRYSVELETLEYDEEMQQFMVKLDRYVIDTLAAFMKQSYQERLVSKLNKIASIVGKDISIDGNGNTKNASRHELEYDSIKSSDMVANQKETAYV